MDYKVGVHYETETKLIVKIIAIQDAQEGREVPMVGQILAAGHKPTLLAYELDGSCIDANVRPLGDYALVRRKFQPKSVWLFENVCYTLLNYEHGRGWSAIGTDAENRPIARNFTEDVLVHSAIEVAHPYETDGEWARVEAHEDLDEIARLNSRIEGQKAHIKELERVIRDRNETIRNAMDFGRGLEELIGKTRNFLEYLTSVRASCEKGVDPHV